MNLLESFIYGLLSGFTEILPISAEAHQEIFKRLFGMEGDPNTVNLLVHISVFVVLIVNCYPDFRVQRSISHRGKRPRLSADSRLVRTAAVPLILGFLLVRYVRYLGDQLPILSLMLILNGLILYVPCRMLQGNKTARAMSGWDGLLLGVTGIAGIIPGISRIGTLVSVGTARGAERSQALKWAFDLTIIALCAVIIMDFVVLFQDGTGVGVGFIRCIIAMVGAASGGYLGIKLLRYLAVKIGFSGFAFYCWGLSLFSFVMYLTVV